MKKQLLLFAMILLPLVASAHDIEVKNADGVTIYYNYFNNGTELEVTFRGSSYNDYSNEYQGIMRSIIALSLPLSPSAIV